MEQYEYCEVSWSEGDHPRLTFFKLNGSQTVAFGQDNVGGDTGDWDALKGAVVELGLSGWELISTAPEGSGPFFKRRLQ